jgi:hypothetical protein
MQSKEKAVQQSESMRKRIDIFWPNSGSRRSGENHAKNMLQKDCENFSYTEINSTSKDWQKIFCTHQQMNVICLASKCSGLLMGIIAID